MRPAATIRPAPSSRATVTAIRPALPVAPRISTDWPGRSPPRHSSGSQAAIAGFTTAAAAAVSSAPGTGTVQAAGARSAIAP
ncbi:hypothetical protein ACFSTI_12940 [Rhizorhabdus histidinilytica]